MTTTDEHPNDALARWLEIRWIRRQFAAARAAVATADPHPEHLPQESLDTVGG